MRLIKLRAWPSIGTGAGALGVAGARPRVEPAERARRVLLTLAFGSLGVLLALLLISDPSAPRRLVESLQLALARQEILPGVSALQVLGGSGGIAAAWLLALRLRRSLAARQANRMAGANPGEKTALVAAWTNKHSQVGSQAAAASAYEPLPVQSVAPTPRAAAETSLEHLADPAAAGDFLNWGRQAARSGDQLVAYRLLMQAVRLDPGSETAWLWLAGTCDERDEAIHCLERVLAINPENRFALRGMSDLLARDRP